MTDTSHLAHIAEDLITHHLQRSGLLVAKPKNDRLGTDLLVFDQIADGVKFCRVQCKGRTVSKHGAKITIPEHHVTAGYLLLAYLAKESDAGCLYFFLPSTVNTWPKNRKGEYTLNVGQNYELTLEPWKFGPDHVQQIKHIIQQAEMAGEFKFVVFGTSHLTLPMPTLEASAHQTYK
ncbi:hypothetical protein [Aromatoleum evansii]|uniref:hypothetical protein n=1 Tax=Aromatoleum evansii TaxID=59406 RepID=UPI00145DA6D6|nr:hypothetical protein [Aromatoleum evansii]NMG31273.1 hypothetical protein [Aromatoleum evansii]